jgi:2-polyprenyl-3-methyl-5-hydroxy-6-metoxy-1,4-benzoquinol methylase
MVKGIQYNATEYDRRYIESIKKRDLQINVSQENVYHINRPNSSYECIIMLEVLKHLDDVGLALAELLRVSSRYVIIFVPHEPLWQLSNLLRCKFVTVFNNTPGHINNIYRRKHKK